METEPKQTMSESEPKIDIRVCTEADIALLDKYIVGPGYHQKRFQSQQEGKSTYLIAWQDDIPVGHLDLIWHGTESPEIQKYLKNIPELNAISVWPPEIRSKGIGRRLIAEAEKIAKEKGFEQAALGVALDNPRAKELYERLGYRDWGHGSYIDKYVGKDENGNDKEYSDECNYLIKKLSPANY